jgi:phosphatidylserine/phosphatidylglycerophosphate/cardiolipin synthase-like enzyme
VRRVLLAAALGLAVATHAAGPVPQPEPAPAPATTGIEAYFTPGDDVARVIAERIANAHETVQVQAYLFTDRRIATALAKAAQRGLAVDLVGDAKQQEAGGLPVLKQLDRAGVRIWLQGDYAAFHNKVVLIDAQSASPVVITGSYNFTRAAQEKNAENVVVIAGDIAIAARFAKDFERHRARASRLQ